MLQRLGVCLLLWSSLLAPASAVKRNEFKTCAQSGFCRRLRDLPPSSGQSSSSKSLYSIAIDTAHYDAATGLFTANIDSAIYPEATLQLSIGVTAEGLARIKVDEVNGLRQRYNETAKWTLLEEPRISRTTTFTTDNQGRSATLSWSNDQPSGTRSTRQARITFSPLKLEFLRDGEVHVSFNEQNLFHMEHFRVKKIGDEPQDPPDVVIDEAVTQARSTFEPFMSEDGAWEETFNGFTDSKPKGPEAYSFDITFPGYQHVFGIPQHASPLSLRTTRGGEGAFTDPYRLYNADTFEYLADSEMSIYGSIPFMHAHKAGSTVAIFSLTGSENWIDITKTSTSTQTHWMAESGILDLFVFLGPTTDEIFEQYGQLTGTTALPQMFAIGHHQCRWNYLNQEDVLQVSANFDKYDIPMDVIWLDIEYAEEHKYFIWDQNNFADPEKMQDGLAAVGRQLVAIVDPHIKRTDNYYVYKEAKEHDLLYKKADGKTEYEGWCWTGSSSWTDFFNPAAFEWWTSLFKFDKFKGSRPNLWVWNDMNEPAIFNGPEVTAPKDNVHFGGWEHRDIHNINGVLFHNATARALVARQDPPRRPFVLSRSFFAGSQRYGAIWTGDNGAAWEHLAVGTPMVLANSIAGMSFAGADVGGFFGNPEEELLTRWYQAGAFHPFFRAHAHLDTKRREPYLFDDPIRGYLRDAIRLRYSLLPAWYTGFFHSSLSGTPIIRPQYTTYPNDVAGFAIDDQFYVGTSGLLVKPVVEKGATETSVYLADDEPHYDYFDYSLWKRASSSASRSHITVPAPLSKLPLFHRGGSILTRRDIVRRAAPLMWKDPITLVVAVDKTGTHATGDIYLDDGDSYGFEQGELVWRGFKLSSMNKKTIMLESVDLVPSYKGLNKDFSAAAATYDRNNKYAQSIASVHVEEIVVLGLSSKPTCVKTPAQLSGLDFEWEEGVSADAGSKKSGQKASILRIKSAGLPITQDWQLAIDFDKSKSCTHTTAVSAYKTLEDPTCPQQGMYRCPNEGHFSSCLLLSRVNDGICDPECCDGSDERDGKVHCPNVCKQANKEYRAKKDEEARIQRVGSKVRGDWSKFGLKEKAKIEKDIVKVEAELVALQEKEATTKAFLVRVEQSEASDIDRKKSSKLYKRLEEHQNAIRSLRKHRDYLQKQVGEISALMVDLKKTFNPNYQDMAVLGAVRAFDDWRRKNGYEINEPDPTNREATDEQQAVEAVEVDFDDLSEDYLKPFEEEDLLGLLTEMDTTSTAQEAANMLFRIEEYLPDGLREHYDSMRTKLLEWLANTGVISRKVIDESTRPDVTKARSAHQAAEQELKNLETKLNKEKESLGKDWGGDWAWKKLDGECIDKDLGEYTYELCWFKNAKQKSNKGHGSTNLGNFDSWDPEKPARSPESYLKQVYTGGQRCWNGPDRSVTVDLQCGTSNAILSVTEPEKCTYLYQVQTPAVCTGYVEEDPIVDHGAEGKSEL